MFALKLDFHNIIINRFLVNFLQSTLRNVTKTILGNLYAIDRFPLNRNPEVDSNALPAIPGYTFIAHKT